MALPPFSQFGFEPDGRGGFRLTPQSANLLIALLKTREVADGGTGADNAADARTNLGLGASDDATFNSVTTTSDVDVGGNLDVVGALTGTDITLTGDAVVQDLEIQDTAPDIYWVETDGATNEKRWRMVNTGGVLAIQSANDSGTPIEDALLVRRSGTAVSDIEGRTTGGEAFFFTNSGARLPGCYATTTANAANVEVASNGGLRRSTSRRDSKQNIQPLSLEASYEIIGNAEPVSFEPKGGGRTHYGFIADDIAAIDPVLGTYGANGRIEAYEPPALIAALMAVVCDLVKRVEELEAK